MPKFSPKKAISHLSAADPVMGGIIGRVGAFSPRPPHGTPFDALLRAIIYQQLSGKAAGTIHGRLENLYGGRPPRPAEILDTPDEDLRSVGLSRQKLSYLKDLAEKAESRTVNFDGLENLGDEEIIASLTQVKGIGRWTVQMFLMFTLQRPDVLPELDLGIQKAVKLAYDLPEMPKPKELIVIGERWKPYRTVASWYLWRSLE
jgi:DNA-3-methyladenine glycosylase II